MGSMDEIDWLEQRKTAIHLLRSGRTARQVADELGRHISWVYKHQMRYEKEGWAGLCDRSRAPQRVANKSTEATLQAVRQARSELEAEAELADTLSYIGAPAIQARLRAKGWATIPGTATIERLIHAAGMTHPRQPKADQQEHYPHLHPSEAHQLVQVDIVPHFLTGGQAVACFNALDVVSRYPCGRQSQRRRAVDAVDSLILIWQELGIPQYTQVDNEGCFSGGFTHPGVLGQVVRLALSVGTELVFSPIYHPESNGYVERFHQDYNRHVWDKTHLEDLADVQHHSLAFYRAYRQSGHHSALNGQCPAQVHTQHTRHTLPADFKRTKGKLALTEGQVHFIRKVTAQRTVSILNLAWSVLKADPGQGVWATLKFSESGASLRIFDAAPDAAQRVCLAEHVFPLTEPVQPLPSAFQRCSEKRSAIQRLADIAHRVAEQVKVRVPFFDVLMARLVVKVPRFSSMS
jgi:transposase InsO family protein